jgi:hypothetical protein
VCNSTYCDRLDFSVESAKIDPGQALAFTSSAAGSRWKRTTVPISSGASASSETGSAASDGSQKKLLVKRTATDDGDGAGLSD